MHTQAQSTATGRQGKKDDGASSQCTRAAGLTSQQSKSCGGVKDTTIKIESENHKTTKPLLLHRHIHKHCQPRHWYGTISHLPRHCQSHHWKWNFGQCLLQCEHIQSSSPSTSVNNDCTSDKEVSSDKEDRLFTQPDAVDLSVDEEDETNNKHVSSRSKKKQIVCWGRIWQSLHTYSSLFFKAAFLDPLTHHYLKKILTVVNFNEVCWSLFFAVYNHHETLNHISFPTYFLSFIPQLKTDITPKWSNSWHFFIFQGINQSQCQWSSIFATTANSLCKNELYQLLFGNDFKMRMQDNNFKVYNCPLCSWWETSGHWYINLGKLAVKYLSVPATSAPSEHIWSQATRFLTVKQNRMSEEVTAAMMYCRENKDILHKCYTKIAKERMHEGSYYEVHGSLA